MNTMLFGKRRIFDLEFDVLDFAFRGSNHSFCERTVAFDELLLTDTLQHQIGWGEVFDIDTSEGLIVSTRKFVNNVQMIKKLKINFLDKSKEKLFIEFVRCNILM